MGIKLMIEVMDRAPRALTAAEWKALMILADDANDQTRMVWSSIESEKFLRRMGVEAERWKNLRAELKRKGVLEQVGQAHKGRTARFRIPQFEQPVEEGHGTSAPVDNSEEGHSFDAPSESKGARNPGERGTESVPLHPSKGHGFDPQRGTEPVPPTPHSSRTTPPPSSPVASSTGGVPASDNKPDGGGGEVDQRNEIAAALVAALPMDKHALNLKRRRQLLTAIADALAVGWTDADLKAELGRDLDKVRNCVSVWLDRLNPKNLGFPQVEAPTVENIRPPRPPWCGICDEHSRMVESRDLDDDDNPLPCPTCRPKPVPAEPRF